MDASTRAALEQLITGATDQLTLGSQLLILLAAAHKVDVAEYVTHARRIADEGLTREEAEAVIKAMETPSTAVVIGQILSAIPPEAEADRRVLDWLWIEAHRVIALHAGNETEPDVEVPNKGFRFATDFLFGWPGGVSDLFQLSPATSAGERAANMGHKRLYKHTVVCPYFHNKGDGDGKHPVNALADVAHTNAVLDEMLANKVSVVGFLFSDSHTVSKADQPRVAAETVRLFDSKVVAWNLFLEPKDTTDESTLDKVAAAVRRETDKPIFIHTYPAASNPSSIEQYTRRSWCDGVLVQVSHPNKPIPLADVPRVAQELLGASHGKWVIAMEYSWKAAEREMGDLWILNGLHGVGDGCNEQYIIRLPLIDRNRPSEDSGSANDPNDLALNLVFSRGKAGGRYVKWSPPIDRDDHDKWPVAHNIHNQPDGLLFGRRFGEKEWHKIEWIKQGLHETGLKNAYDDVNDPKYDLGWKPGEKVELQVRNTKGQIVVPNMGTWRLQ